VRTSLPIDGVVVHPYGPCESDEVGHGTRVLAFAHVLAGTRIGRDCNICDGEFVEDDGSLGDRVTVKNHVMIFEGVHVADDAFLRPGSFTDDLRPRARLKRDCAELLTIIVQRGTPWAQELWWYAA
jgi:UDP-2-acetamido-3-amino-2,3-dideoxy-glucuronate N-acetyltransferase